MRRSVKIPPLVDVRTDTQRSSHQTVSRSTSSSVLVEHIPRHPASPSGVVAMPYTLVSNALRHLGQFLADWHADCPMPPRKQQPPFETDITVYTTTTPSTSQRGSAPIPATSHHRSPQGVSHIHAAYGRRSASSHSHVAHRTSHQSTPYRRRPQSSSVATTSTGSVFTSVTTASPTTVIKVTATTAPPEDTVLDKEFHSEERLVWMYRQLERGLVELPSALQLLHTLDSRHRRGGEQANPPFESSFHLLRSLLLNQQTNAALQESAALRAQLHQVVKSPLLLATCQSLLTVTPTPSGTSTFLVDFFGPKRVASALNLAVQLLVECIKVSGGGGALSCQHDEAIKVLQLFSGAVREGSRLIKTHELLSPDLCIQLLEAAKAAPPTAFMDAASACAVLVGHSLPHLCRVPLTLSSCGGGQLKAAAAALISTTPVLRATIAKGKPLPTLVGWSGEDRRAQEVALRSAFVAGCVELNDLEGAMGAIPKKDTSGAFGVLIHALLDVGYVVDACKALTACDTASLKYIPRTATQRLSEAVSSHPKMAPSTSRIQQQEANREAAFWESVRVLIGAIPQGESRRDAVSATLLSGNWTGALRMVQSEADRRKVEDYISAKLKLPLAPPSLVKGSTNQMLARWAVMCASQGEGKTSAHGAWVDALRQLASSSPPPMISAWVLQRLSKNAVRLHPPAYDRAFHLLALARNQVGLPTAFDDTAASLYDMAPTTEIASELFSRSRWDVALQAYMGSTSTKVPVSPTSDLLINAVTTYAAGKLSTSATSASSSPPSSVYLTIRMPRKGRRAPSKLSPTVSIRIRSVDSTPSRPQHEYTPTSSSSWEAALEALKAPGYGGLFGRGQGAQSVGDACSVCAGLGAVPKVAIVPAWNAVTSRFGSVSPDALNAWLRACGSKGNSLAGQALLERSFVVRTVPSPSAVADLLLQHPSGTRVPVPLTAALLPVLTVCGRFDDKALCVGLLDELLCRSTPGTAAAPSIGWLAVLASNQLLLEGVSSDVRRMLLSTLDKALVDAILRFASHAHRMEGAAFIPTLHPDTLSQMCRSATMSGIHTSAAMLLTGAKSSEAIFVGPVDRVTTAMPATSYPHQLIHQLSNDPDVVDTRAVEAAINFMYRQHQHGEWASATQLCAPILHHMEYTQSVSGPIRTTKGPLSLPKRHKMTSKLVQLMCAGGAPTEVLCSSLDAMGAAKTQPPVKGAKPTKQGMPVRLSPSAMLAVSARLCGEGLWAQAIQVLKTPTTLSTRGTGVVHPVAVRARTQRMALLMQTARLAALHRHFNAKKGATPDPAHLDELVAKSSSIATSSAKWRRRMSGPLRPVCRLGRSKGTWGRPHSRPRLLSPRIHALLRDSYKQQTTPAQPSFTFFEKLLADPRFQ